MRIAETHFFFLLLVDFFLCKRPDLFWGQTHGQEVAEETWLGPTIAGGTKLGPGFVGRAWLEPGVARGAWPGPAVARGA